MKKSLFILLSLFSIAANAQQKAADSISKINILKHDTITNSGIKPAAFIVPAALVTYGGLSLAVHPVRRIDYFVEAQVHKSAPSFSTNAESYFMWTPIALVYGLNLTGIHGKNNFVDRSAILVLATGFAGVSTELTKRITHRVRANNTNDLSFPSMHTSIAFMGAEFLAQEYDDQSPWFGVLGYGVGAATGVFRIYNRQHWFSDVVAGAGYGIISTKLAYLIYPTVKSWFIPHNQHAGNFDSGKKSMFSNTMLMPAIQNGSPGFSFSTNF